MRTVTEHGVTYHKLSAGESSPVGTLLRIRNDCITEWPTVDTKSVLGTSVKDLKFYQKVIVYRETQFIPAGHIHDTANQRLQYVRHGYNSIRVCAGGNPCVYENFNFIETCSVKACICKKTRSENKVASKTQAVHKEMASLSLQDALDKNKAYFKDSLLSTIDDESFIQLWSQNKKVMILSEESKRRWPGKLRIAKLLGLESVPLCYGGNQCATDNGLKFSQYCDTPDCTHCENKRVKNKLEKSHSSEANCKRAASLKQFYSTDGARQKASERMKMTWLKEEYRTNMLSASAFFNVTKELVNRRAETLKRTLAKKTENTDSWDITTNSGEVITLTRSDVALINDCHISDPNSYSCSSLAYSYNLHSSTHIIRLFRRVNLEWIKGKRTTGVSRGETEVFEFVKSICPDAVQSFRPAELRVTGKVRSCELDIFVPSKQYAIEYNGLFFHSDNRPNPFDKNSSLNNKTNHMEKFDYCLLNKIKLQQFSDNDWLCRRSIVMSMIRSSLGITNRIYARTCAITEADTIPGDNFLEMTHIRGCGRNGKTYLLLDGVRTVSALKVRKNGDFLEIERYSSSLDTTVVGGFSKLLKHVERLNPGKHVLSYSYNDFGHGNVYEKNGFIKIENIPYFYYTDGTNLYSRQDFMKHKLLERFGGDSSKTEEVLAAENGYYRYYTAGNTKWIKYAAKMVLVNCNNNID